MTVKKTKLTDKGDLKKFVPHGIVRIRLLGPHEHAGVRYDSGDVIEVQASKAWRINGLIIN